MTEDYYGIHRQPTVNEPITGLREYSEPLKRKSLWFTLDAVRAFNPHFELELPAKVVFFRAVRILRHLPKVPEST